MDDDLTRAQRYLQLAVQLLNTAKLEPSLVRREELEKLANQYEKLANKLIRDHKRSKAN